MPTNKQGKVTGLRLTTEARAVLERVSSEGRFSQGDLVSALLEEHADNLDAFEKVVSKIRDRRITYAKRGRSAAGAKKGAWSSYEETWHVNDREHHVIWTRGELEQFADRFLDHDYWRDWIDHWYDCDEPDRLRLADSLTMQLCTFPVPLRWRWLSLVQGIWAETCMIDDPDFMGGAFVHPEIEDMVRDVFEGLPYPTENCFRGVVLTVVDQLNMKDAGDFNLGVVTNMFEPDEWRTMMEYIDTRTTIQLDKIAGVDGGDMEIHGKITEWLGDMERKARDMIDVAETPHERIEMQRNAFRRLSNKLGVQRDLIMTRLVPQSHQFVFGDVSAVHQSGDKKFSVQDGPFPRSAALFRIAAALQIAKEAEAVVTVSDLYAFAGVAKSQVSQLLKEWPMFFDRDSDENGPKRGGWIRLSSIGYDYFTPQRCVSEGGIPPNYMEAASAKFDDITERRQYLKDKHPELPDGYVEDEHFKWATACRHVLGDSD